MTLRDNLRLVLVSPEFLLAVSVVAAWFWLGDAFDSIGRGLIGSEKGLFHVLISAPMALFGAICGLGWKVLFPSAKNRVLTEWEDYGRLKARIIFAVSVAALGTVGSVVTFLSASVARPDVLALLALLFLLPVIADFLTLLAAVVTVREIVEQLKQLE